MKQFILMAMLCFGVYFADGQVKILFDATKAETAGNADWIIDADAFNLGYNNGTATIGGNDANAQATATPLQTNITSSTAETFWKGGLSYWAIDCVKKGYQVETLPYNGVISYGNVSNPQDLTHYNIFVVDEPNILFTSSEKIALINFVQNGGSLFIIGNHSQSDRNNDGYDSPGIWNDLFTNNGIISNPFGISFDLTKFSAYSSNISTYANDSLLHGSYGNVSQVAWNSGTTMTINPSINSSVKAAVYKSGTSNIGNTKVMVAYARYGLGKVVAFGDSSPFDDGTGDTNDQLYDGYIADANGNHQKLIMNATQWLATNASILPEQIDFSCFRNGRSVNINWVIATEINTFCFNVQKSYNGTVFFDFNIIKATGKLKYSCIDKLQQENNNVYYRLKTVEKDGSIQYSKIVRLGANNYSSSKLYPNPAKEFIHFLGNDITSVKIRNCLGNIVLSTSIIENNKINISGLQNGLYFIETCDKSGNVITEKMMKQ